MDNLLVRAGGRFGGIPLSPTLYPSPTLRSPPNTYPPPPLEKFAYPSSNKIRVFLYELVEQF